MSGYLKMKGELDEEVQKLGFGWVVILRPGLLMGTREETRGLEGVFRGIAAGLKAVGGGAFTNFWAQPSDCVARAAIRAGEICAEGKRERGVWVLGQAEIVKLGSEAEG